MLKSFTGLWLMVFGPLLLLIYPSDFNPIIKFNEHIEGKRFTEIYQGTFTLIEKQLLTAPMTQWPDMIQLMSSHFGYELRLLRFTEEVIGKGREADLQQGQVIFVNAEPEYLLKKIGESDFVLQLFTDFSENIKISSGAKGTVYLLRDIFNQSTSTQWPALIRQLKNEFPYNLRVQNSQSVQLNSQEERSLKTYSFFWRGDPSLAVSLYTPLKGNDYFLIAEQIPMSSIDTSAITLVILIFVLTISVCMFLWVYPLWRDLKHLVSATFEFGKGNLATRAIVTKISVVAALSQAFNQMAERTENLLRGQRTLINAIAHDLRTPLYRLRFAFEIVMETSKSQEDVKYWTSISKSIEDLDHLINQTLLLSRYSSDRQLIQLAEYDLSLLINEECQLIFQYWPAIDFRLHLQLEQERTITRVDEAAIKRVVNNLLTNACKFAQSIVVVKLHYQQSSGDYVLEVDDDGPGIPEDDIERIFLPFEQLSSNHRDIASGHGLGLAIVRHIASWHSGAVTAARSDLGGASLIFRWPAQ
jgi:two-component system sensor histidine kinase RstB